MPFFLDKRDTTSHEWMDDPDCSHAELVNTYRQFSTINAMISGWSKIYRHYIRPACKDRKKRYSLLDIGFGGGDIPIKLAKWAARDGITLDITAIETDRRAVDFVQTLNTPPNIDFLHRSSTEILKQGKSFDWVISNHLLHHLGKTELRKLLSEARELSTTGVLFNDIERSDVGYALFTIFSRPVFRSSFITHDGLTSIKRSYTLGELKTQAPDDWNVQRLFPFRLLLHYNHANK